MTVPAAGSDDAGLGLARRCAEVMWTDDSASRGLGMRLESVSPGRARVRMRVTEPMVNGHGTCHGGFVAALADSAFAFACNTYDDVTVAAGFDIVFVAAAHLGDELAADAVERVRRGRSGVYDVTVTRLSADAAESTTAGGEPTAGGGEPTAGGGEPTSEGAEPTTAGGESTASGGDPTVPGGEPTTARAEPVEVVAEFRGRSRSLGRPVLPRPG